MFLIVTIQISLSFRFHHCYAVFQSHPSGLIPEPEGADPSVQIFSHTLDTHTLKYPLTAET